MTMLNTPSAPATSRQLWMLHRLTKQDTRSWTLTMAQASEQIDSLLNKAKTTPVNTQAKTTPAKSQHPTREVIQGTRPTGKTDLDQIRQHFMANAYQLGQDKAGNKTATIDFYEFQCEQCLFGQDGICKPAWEYASSITCQGKTESVSFDCANYEPVSYSVSEYCQRPRGTQCQRKRIDNHCLECGYRSTRYQDSWSRHAHATYIPTIGQRIADNQHRLSLFDKDSDYIPRLNTVLRLLSKLNTPAPEPGGPVSPET